MQGCLLDCLLLYRHVMVRMCLETTIAVTMGRCLSHSAARSELLRAACGSLKFALKCVSCNALLFTAEYSKHKRMNFLRPLHKTSILLVVL
jgi:hypothetical protein